MQRILIVVSALLLSGCTLPFKIVWNNQQVGTTPPPPSITTSSPTPTSTSNSSPTPISASDSQNLTYQFSLGPNVSTPRMGHHQFKLANGKILLVGGHGSEFTSLSSAELFDPVTAKFTSIAMNYPHDMPGVVALDNNRYLIAGGSSNLGVPHYSTSEIFDQATMQFTKTADLQLFRSGFDIGPVGKEKLLVASAWYTHNQANSQSEIFDTKAQTFSLTGKLTVPRSYALVLPTQDGNAQVLGGIGPTGTPGFIDEVEEYHVASGKFTTIRKGIIANESGWVTTSHQYMRPLSEQQLTDGRYLLLLYKSEASETKYQLVTYDPKTKAVENWLTNPVLPTSTTHSLWPPVVDTKNQAAYLLALVTSQNQILVYKLDLNTKALIASNPYTLPAGYYLGGTVVSLLPNGLLITGGHTETGYRTNFTPHAKTIQVTF